MNKLGIRDLRCSLFLLCSLFLFMLLFGSSCSCSCSDNTLILLTSPGHNRYEYGARLLQFVVSNYTNVLPENSDFEWFDVFPEMLMRGLGGSITNPVNEIAFYVTVVQEVRRVSNISHRSSHTAGALVEQSPLQYSQLRHIGRTGVPSDEGMQMSC